MITIEDLQAALNFLDDGLELNIHVQPGARATCMAGIHGDRIKVSIKERAVDGKATEATLAMIANTLGTAKSAVRLVRGARSRQKTVRVEGNADELAERLARAMNSA